MNYFAKLSIALGGFFYAVIVNASPTQQRIEQAVAAHQPIIVHVIVALADNKNQWIVPVADALGNGQNSRSNLYWGAMYGVKTYMTRQGQWELRLSTKTQDQRILERIILKKRLSRKGKDISVYMVADAWDGKYILPSIEQYLRYNAGYNPVDISLDGIALAAGSNAHLIVYIGHNALMDFAGSKDWLLRTPPPAVSNPQNDAIVLACKSQRYFSERLNKLKAHPLILTHGLMAPEAYTLDAAIEAWVKGANDTQIRKAGAKAYSFFQKSSLRAAEKLMGAR